MDKHSDIPADVRLLIGRHIDSIVQLDLLLLVYRDPGVSWTAEEAARELRIEAAWTAAQLDQLATRGLFQRGEGPAATYRCASDAAPGVAETVARLAQAYADRRVSIIALIYAKPSDSLRTFADAFRFRKGPEDD